MNIKQLNQGTLRDVNVDIAKNQNVLFQTIAKIVKIEVIGRVQFQFSWL